jgi:hypothetical protein
LLSKLRTRLTFANAVSVIALFVALGGSSYAALIVTSKNVRNNSLTSADIRNNTIRGVDVKDRSLLARDFAGGQLPSGAQGPAGERGAVGATGATGPAGPARFVDVKWASAPTTRTVPDGGCTVQQEWRECAPVTVAVPPGATYKISVSSSGSYFSFGAELPNRVASCVSVRRSDVAFETTPTQPGDQPIPASCDANGTGGITWEKDGADADAASRAEARIANLTTSGIATLGGGASGTTYTVGSAVWAQKHLSQYSPLPRSVRVQTMVEIADVTP